MGVLGSGDFMEGHVSRLLLIFAVPFILATLLFITRAIYNVFFHPLRAYPGPMLWAASNFPYALSLYSGNSMSKLLDMHEKYGKVVRIGPNDLSWVDDVVWRDAWAHRQGHQEFSKDLHFRNPTPSGAFGILTAGREDHSRYRRLFSHAFSDRGMREQQPTIQSYVDGLIDGLKKNASEGPQNMVSWFNWTTFDIIGRLSFGEDFGCIEDGRTHPWIAAIFGSIKVTTMVILFRRLGLEFMLPYLVSEKTLAMRRYNYEYAANKIDKRLKRGTEQGDFLDNVLKHSTDGDKNGMTRHELEANAAHLVLAGSETTATLLSGTTYQLLKCPDALERVVAEIRGAFTSVDEIDLFSTAKLKYTLAVLEETMRIYPPVPSQAPRTVPEGGDTVNNQFLPGGTIIHLPQFVATHLKSNFTRPFEFHPERFLGDSEKPSDIKLYNEFKNDNYAVMQPFSVGSRNCIGRNLAYAEMRLILAKFFFTFDIEMDERAEWKNNWTDQSTFILWDKHPLMVKLKIVN